MQLQRNKSLLMGSALPLPLFSINAAKVEEMRGNRIGRLRQREQAYVACSRIPPARHHVHSQREQSSQGLTGGIQQDK